MFAAFFSVGAGLAALAWSAGASAHAMPGAEGEVAAELERPLPAGAVMRLGTTRLRHEYGATAVAFTLDGKCLVSSGSGDGIRIWDVATGRQMRALGEETGGTYALALSPDGKRLITVGHGAGDKIRVWDFGAGTVLMSAPGDRNGVNHLALSPDGQSFATAGEDGNVYLWKMENGLEFIETPLGGSVRGPRINCLAFSPDGKLLAAGDSSGTVQIWEVDSDKEPLSIRAHKDRVNSIAFAPGGKALGTAAARYERVSEGKRRLVGEVRLWDPATGEKVLEFETDPDESVGAIAFSPDGHMLASVGTRGSVALWDPATGRKTRTLQARQVVGSIYQGIAFSSDGRLLATIGPGDVISLWKVATGEVLFQDPGESVSSMWCVAFSPDGAQIVSCGDGIRAWEAASGRYLRSLRGHEGFVYDVAFSPDGKLLASGSGGLDGSVRLWDAASGKEVRKFPGEEWVQAYRVAFSPDGSLLAALYCRETPPTLVETSSVRVWQVGTGQELLNLGPVHGWGKHLAFSADGKVLACVCRGGGAVYSWDIPAGSERPPFEMAGETPSQPIGLSRDAGILVDFDRGTGAVRLWELATGKMIRSISIPGERVWYAGFSKDNALVAIASLAASAEPRPSYARLLRVFEMATGRELMKFDTNDEGTVISWAFSPDGKRLVTGMTKTTVLVWDLSSGK